MTPWVFFITRIRTCRDWRPMTEQIGGRSFAYVPRPRRLLARQRGGSSGLPCHSPFFPRILEHLICFYFLIYQRGFWLFSLGVCLQLVPHFCCCCAADAQFPRQFRRWLALTNTPDKQDRLFWTKITAFKDSSAIQVVNAAAFLAAINIQLAALCLSKPACLFKTSPAMGALQPIGMKVFPYPVEASFTIH